METVTLVVQCLEDVARCPQRLMEGRRSWNHTLHVSAARLQLPFFLVEHRITVLLKRNPLSISADLPTPNSLDKPWSARPASLPPHQPPSPTLPPSPASLDGSDDGREPYLEKPQIRRRSLPHGLLDAVRNTPPQRSLTNYDEVHAWWWIVYEDLLDDLKARGVDWESVDKWVTRWRLFQCVRPIVVRVK